jgi:hypothetical protein
MIIWTETFKLAVQVSKYSINGILEGVSVRMIKGDTSIISKKDRLALRIDNFGYSIDI